MINKLREWAEGMKEKSSRDIGDFFNGYYVAMDDILTKLSELESSSIKEVQKYLEGKVKRGMAMGFREDFIWYEEAIAALSELKADKDAEAMQMVADSEKENLDLYRDNTALWEKNNTITAEVERLKGEVQQYKESLVDLVQLKRWKDNYGKDEYYLSKVDKAWEEAYKLVKPLPPNPQP